MSRTDLYTEMKLLGYAMGGSSNALGTAGEIFAYLALRNSGYRALIDHERHYGDIKVTLDDGSILRCEVKTARCNADGRYNFLLHGKRGGKTETLCVEVDFVMILAVSVSGNVRVFIIPRSALGNQSTVKIPKVSVRSRNKYGQFEQSITKISLDGVIKSTEDKHYIPF